MTPKPLTESDVDGIEDLAKANAAETYRGALLALVDEVRRCVVPPTTEETNADYRRTPTR